jgi:hypothetical protein
MAMEDLLGGGDRVALAFVGCQKLRRRDDCHMKTRCTESIEYIWAIDAHMVVLTINPLTLSRFYDGGVFEGWIIRPHRNLD